MNTYRKVLFAGVFALAVTGLLVALNASQGDGQDPPNDPDKSIAPIDPNKSSQEKKNLPAKEPATKESPAKTEEGKEPLAKEPTKTAPKIITMAEAVVIAERVGKGYTLKAERKEKPALTFKFDILSRTGQKVKIELGPDGTVRSNSEPTMEKTPDGKTDGDKKGGKKNKDR